MNEEKPGKGLSTSGVSLMGSMDQAGYGCTDTPPEPGHDRPGYILCDWVDDFIDTPAGPVPRVKTELTVRDRVSTGVVRCGINRYQYTVVPGLYAVGQPDAGSEVVVTANFKLTFDMVRTALKGLNIWILVLDTKGINVWCAAGKGTFGTGELVYRIENSELAGVVDHKRVIVPQLGATGVSAKEVKARSGFRVVYGPVRASDIPGFLENNRKAAPEMREVTFTMGERFILTPVEVQIVLKPALITALVLFILSGFGPGIFSFGAAWTRGWTGLGAMAAGIISGAVVTPVLLPFIPVKEFALKGIITGCVTAVILLAALPAAGFVNGLALFLFTVTISSFLAMNFTGTTPFTSPSGVEKEMKRYIPAQLACLVLSTGFWIYGAF
ncbi:MAG: hypothetical protein MI863_27860 [Desulfobacterales bacterium]|nr:hypothetical protein [Desulfobacterales bacterium]